MAFHRVCILIAFLWIVEFLFLPIIPLAKILVDPLFIFLVFRGLQASSGRFLWVEGVSLGLLKDLATGGLFGGFACSFGFIGWLLGQSQHFVEKEDPLIQAVWAGFLTAFQWVVYAFLVVLSEKTVGWGWGWWFFLPLAAVANCGFAFWVFPPFRRFLKVRDKRRIDLFVAQ